MIPAGKSFNPLIGIAKMLMCFAVILCHFYTGTPGDASVPVRPFILLRPFAVPVFMTISFFLGARHLVAAEKGFVGRRFRRLFTPISGWALVYFCLLTLLPFPSPTVRDLGWQLLTGHSAAINPPMWFMSVLMLFTIGFALFFKQFGTKATPLLIATAIIALGIGATGTHMVVFGSLRYELRYPLGRIIEMIPFATAGILMGIYPLPVLKRPVATGVIFICAAVFIFALAKPHWLADEGFGYNGLGLFFGSVCMVEGIIITGQLVKNYPPPFVKICKTNNFLHFRDLLHTLSPHPGLKGHYVSYGYTHGGVYALRHFLCSGVLHLHGLGPVASQTDKRDGQLEIRLKTTAWVS